MIDRLNRGARLIHLWFYLLKNSSCVLSFIIIVEKNLNTFNRSTLLRIFSQNWNIRSSLRNDFETNLTINNINKFFSSLLVIFLRSSALKTIVRKKTKTLAASTNRFDRRDRESTRNRASPYRWSNEQRDISYAEYGIKSRDWRYLSLYHRQLV